jgi:hypothetical protein
MPVFIEESSEEDPTLGSGTPSPYFEFAPAKIQPSDDYHGTPNAKYQETMWHALSSPGAVVKETPHHQNEVEGSKYLQKVHSSSVRHWL